MSLTVKPIRVYGCDMFGIFSGKSLLFTRWSEQAANTKKMELERKLNQQEPLCERNYCSLSCEGIYITDNELCSGHIGEIEHQLSDEVMADIEKLNPLERAIVDELAGIRYGNLTYIPLDYNRWVLTLDYDRLAAHLDIET